MKISRLLLVLVLLSGGAAFQAQASLDSRLIDAAEAGEAAEVRKLLSDCASVNAHSPIGKTALMFAAQEGRLEVVEILLDSGLSPADYARGHGYQKIVELLEGVK